MKKKKKGNLLNFILVLVLIAGLSLLLYPTFSDLWNSTRQSQVITNYAQDVESLNEETYEELWEAAREYNKNIFNRQNLYILSQEELLQYEQLLNVSGHGIMAYIDIPKIDCSLPIYHGTSDDVLQVAVGHLDWSSLPIGGEGSHCIVSGHRGLPSAKLFTDLDEIVVGDQFFITVLNEKLAYEVDQIVTVLPEEVEELAIEEDKDYVTLVTCTPYGVNSHRLLVRGHRIEYIEPETEEIKNPIKEVIVTRNLSQEFRDMVIIVFSGLAILILLMMIIFRKKKKK